MTHGDWVKVVKAVRGVDGDCGICVEYVCVKLVKVFPMPKLTWRAILMEALVGESLWDVGFVDNILREAGPTRECSCGKVAYLTDTSLDGTAIFSCESCVRDRKRLRG